MSLFDIVEGYFINFGLSTPTLRFAAAGGAAAAVLYGVKPRVFFLDDGSSRPLAFIDSKAKGGTNFPWWAAAASVGAVAAVFI